MKMISVVAAVAVLLLSAPFDSAHADNLRSLAQLTMSLDQPLSDENKAWLDGVVDSLESTDEEVTIAMALSNFDKTVGPGDAERLIEVINDDFYDESARALAGILLRLNQNPNPDDAVTLAALAGQDATSSSADD